MMLQGVMAAGLLVIGLTQSTEAAFVIDTNPTWSGDVNYLWEGSGQSMTIDAANTMFDQSRFTFIGIRWKNV